MALTVNPLNKIRLTNPIHSRINWHFRQFPLREEFEDTNLKTAYYFHFILGLLNSIASQPQKDATKIFYQRTDNNLRVFVVRGGEVTLHNFYYGEPSGSRIITTDECEFIGISPPTSINFVYSVREHSSSALKLIEKVEEPPQPGRQPFLGTGRSGIFQIAPVDDTFARSIRYKVKFSVEYLRNVHETLNLHHMGLMLHLPLLNGAFWQGFLFKSMSITYYKLLPKSPINVISQKRDGVSICLPRDRNLREFVLFNFSPDKHAGYNLLLKAKNEDLSIIQLDVASAGDSTMTEGSRVQFTFNSILKRMREDLLASNDQATVVEEYGHQIRKFLQTHKATDPFNLEHFFRSYFITTEKTRLYDGPGAMLVQDEHSSYLLSFTSNRPGIIQQCVPVNNDQILHLTFTRSDEGLENLLLSTSPYNRELGDPGQWPVLTHSPLKQQVRKMLIHNNGGPRSVPILKQDVERTFADLSRSMHHITQTKQQYHSFLKGVAAHFANSEISTSQAGISIALRMNVFNQLQTVHFSLPTEKQANVVQEVLNREIEESSSFSLAYNAHSNEFAMVGLSRETSPYTTDNVQRACSSGLRKKRQVPVTGCLALKREEDDTVVVDKAKVEEIIRSKTTLMQEHLTSIHEISGKIQAGLLARDVLGDIVPGDYKSLAVHTMFFGTMLASQKLGRVVATAGERIGSKALEFSGLCLPKLAFDAYMIYQLVEKIKNGEVSAAITTGVYLLLDLAECAAQIMVAFGLINPIIVPILAIASTALLVGQAIYEAAAKVQQINRIIHLDTEEYFYEYAREFFHFGTDKRIQHLVDEKQANEFLASRVFEKYPDIKRFLVSAAIYDENKNLSFIDDNIIDLTRMQTIKERSRAMPDIKKDRAVFCSMREQEKPSLLPNIKKKLENFIEGIMHIDEKKLHAIFNDFSFNDFICQNAFGVSRPGIELNSEKTLFLLFDGNDRVVGFPNASNIFLLGNGSKRIHGGHRDDYFKISADFIYGHLNGGAGYDTIDLGEFTFAGQINIQKDFITMRNSGHSIRLVNFEVVIGRADLPDHMSVCNEKRVDLAGAIGVADSIVISDNAGYNCLPATNLTVYLRRNTHVHCTSSKANITYIVVDQTDSDLLVIADVGTHHFYFEKMELNDMRIIDLNASHKEFLFVDNGIKLEIQGSPHVSFQFNDGVKMIILADNATAYLKTSQSIFDIMEKYLNFIENDQFTTLIIETDEEKLVFSRNHHEINVEGKIKELNIIIDNNEIDAHLVGHKDAENYFFLLSDHDVNNAQKIDLKIYPQGSISYIDLHQFARQIHEDTNSMYGLQAIAEKLDDNVELELLMIHNRMEEPSLSIGKIMLMNLTENFDSISIDVYGRNKLELIDDEILLSPKPVSLNKSVSIVQPGNFDFYTNLHIDRYAGDMEAFSQNTTMMLTNTLTANGENFTTIFLSDFWLNRNKYQTLDLVFKDQMIQLKDFVGPWKKEKMRKMSDFWISMLDLGGKQLFDGFPKYSGMFQRESISNMM